MLVYYVDTLGVAYLHNSIFYGSETLSNTTYRKCRWCGQTYSGNWNYDCCGEKCFREWTAANPNGVQEADAAIEAQKEHLKGCGKTLLQMLAVILIGGGVAGLVAYLNTIYKFIK